jgi:NADP-dependent 3-hydroxy acid dehydrogenase YdfG
MISLKNKIVIITGASSGIGKAAALQFARKGSKVILAARREDRLKELKEQIDRFNGSCISIKTDITDEKQVKRLFDFAEENFGTTDILVNNAGRGLKSGLVSISTADWDSLLAVNLTAVFLCTREAVLRMRAKNSGGHIITVSSIAGLISTPGFSAYCATKSAVNAFNSAIRWELSKYKIKISTVHPFMVQTEFFDTYPEKPGMGPALMPDDIARHIIAIAERSFLKRSWSMARNFVKRIFNFSGNLIRK